MIDENLNFEVRVTTSEISKKLNMPFFIRNKKNRKTNTNKKKRKENE